MRKSHSTFIHAASAALLAAIGACAVDSPGTTQTTGRSVEALDAAAPACGGTGAHDKHMSLGGGVTCTACHTCGGLYGFGSPVTFAGGTTTAGGTMNKGPTTTTCSVGCHNPFGAPAQTIAWNAQGPLACNGCHDQGLITSSIISGHPADTSSPTANRAACQNCHVIDQHLGGHVRIQGPSGVIDVAIDDGVQLAGACRGCHGGTGRTLAAQTPPLLVGYDAGGGDFHGARAGAGWGGTLASPYQRGQAALPCTACHDAHSSANPFMFSATVNGGAVLPLSITRAGVGAEGLCQNCHLGQRHAGCMTAECHGTTDPAPAGKPCLFCHGHEGIVNFDWPSWGTAHPNNATGCAHCHSSAAMSSAGGWLPLVMETTPPTISGIVVTVGYDSATVTWTTDEKSTSAVEWGPSDASNVTANAYSLDTSHQVTVTGLASGTTYAFRVRSQDNLRNVAESPLSSFTTTVAGAPLAPVLIAHDTIFVYSGDPAIAALQWNPSASPLGNPIQYRAVVGRDPSFQTIMYDSGWQSGTSYTVQVPYGSPNPVQYYWRVQAQDAVSAIASPWSATGQFSVWMIDPYGG